MTCAGVRSCQRVETSRKGAAQACDHAFFANREHGIEQRRSHRAAHNRHAGGIDQQAGLYAFGSGNFAQSMVAGIVIPVGKSGKRIGEFAEEHGESLVLPEFFARFGIVFKFVA